MLCVCVGVHVRVCAHARMCMVVRWGVRLLSHVFCLCLLREGECILQMHLPVCSECVGACPKRELHQFYRQTPEDRVV